MVEEYNTILDDRIGSFDGGPDGPDQLTMFEVRDEPEDVWRGLPTFEQRDLSPYRSVTVHIMTAKAFEEFKRAIGATGRRSAGGMNSLSFYYPPEDAKDWQRGEWVSDGAEGLAEAVE